MSKLKNLKKKVCLLATTAALTVGSALSAFAAESSTNTSQILTDSFNNVKSDLLGYIAIALPVGLGIFGAFFGIKKAIAFFRSVSSKS